MNTSQYDPQTRKNLKRFQRSPAYEVMKKEQIAARVALAEIIKKRNETIELLKKKLVESGVSADEVAKLA